MSRIDQIGKVKIVDGDLLTAEVDVIVQQCNCLTVYGLGLSESIQKTLYVDPYGHRKNMKGKKNCAIKEDRDIPGTTLLYQGLREESKNGANKKALIVACLMAQYTPSKPGLYHKDQIVGEIDPVSGEPLTDSYAQRFQWFKTCLIKLAEMLDENKYGLNGTQKIIIKEDGELIDIAFPYMIGCGLAGGNWKDYLAEIGKWANLHKDKYNVVILKK